MFAYKICKMLLESSSTLSFSLGHLTNIYQAKYMQQFRTFVWAATENEMFIWKITTKRCISPSRA